MRKVERRQHASSDAAVQAASAATSRTHHNSQETRHSRCIVGNMQQMSGLDEEGNTSPDILSVFF